MYDGQALVGCGTDEDSEELVAELQSAAVLLEVVRVGPFGKRVLLDGDVSAGLVVLCAGMPTTTLLQRVATLMATEMAVSCSDLKRGQNLEAEAEANFWRLRPRPRPKVIIKRVPNND